MSKAFAVLTGRLVREGNLPNSAVHDECSTSALLLKDFCSHGRPGCLDKGTPQRLSPAYHSHYISSNRQVLKVYQPLRGNISCRNLQIMCSLAYESQLPTELRRVPGHRKMAYSTSVWYRQPPYTLTSFRYPLLNLLSKSLAQYNENSAAGSTAICPQLPRNGMYL